MIRDTADTDIPLEPQSGRRWLRNGGIALAVVAVLWAGLRFISQSGPTVSSQRLRIAEVTRGPFISDLSAQGRVVAARSPTLYAPAPGTVTLAVQAGDTVEVGQLLATLYSPDLDNERARADAELQGLRATYARERLDVQTRRLQNQQAVDLARVTADGARRELQRSQNAHAQGLLPVMEVDRRGDELAAALVRLEHARAEAELQDDSLDLQLQGRLLEVDRQQLVVDNLQRRVDELSVRAPLAGRVGNVLVEQRAAVSTNAPLLAVVDLSALEVEIQVPETYADTLGLDMPAEVRIGALTVPARLTAISPEVQNNQVTGRVSFTGSAPPELRQNQRVSVSVLLDHREGVLQLPRGGFLDQGGGRQAYVVNGELAERRPIQTGAIALDRVEVLSGLAQGERVVIAGGEAFDNAPSVRLRD